MLKLIFSTFIIVLLTTVSPSYAANSQTIQSQYGVSPGLSGNSGYGGCVNPDIYVECVFLPSNSSVLSFAGTITVKSPGVEVLFQTICNGKVVFQGEYRTVGTWPIMSPPGFPQGFTGPCWDAWQTISTYATPDGWEIQLTLFYQ